jgi:hypothetical protein
LYDPFFAASWREKVCKTPVKAKKRIAGAMKTPR